MQHANFEVDPRLAALLGETYRSTEQAIKELVDNAWDADAECVSIALPEPMTLDPIRLEDDGTGMTEREVRQEYLRIARDRRALKGDRTIGKNRRIKGRKGIGKFAGLTVAEAMVLETRARGLKTRLTIHGSKLLATAADLETVELPLETTGCSIADHGTAVILSDLHQNLAFPVVDRLRQLLVLDYGRETGFTILVNGQVVGFQDVPGEAVTKEIELPTAGLVKLAFKITDEQQPARQSGLVVRVGGKVVGQLTHFGLEGLEEVPKKLLRRVVGEVEADSLSSDVTADWGAIIENSRAYGEIGEWVRSELHEKIEATFKREINLARARIQQEVNRRLETLPEHRRRFADQALQRIMQRFYGESDERVRPIVSVVLDALEKDEYRTVLEKIHNASQSDVSALAEALCEFGVLEISLIAQQAHSRLQFLDELDRLILNPRTAEKDVHRALATNLWVFGPEFALMSSNETLSKIVAKYTDEKFTGNRARKRPDLLLLNQLGKSYTLIEFKRPDHTIERLDVAQAEGYRDDLSSRFHPIELLVIGKEFDLCLVANPPTRGKVLSYGDVVSRARSELAWIMAELTSNALPSSGVLV
jgi:Histidine kinase-, DNA gyrase B-, and HSP90-like ATPase